MNVPSPYLLEALAAAPSLTGTKDDFRITLPHGCYVDAQTENQAGKKTTTIDYIEVPNDLQNHGLGGRLVRSLFRYCADTNVDIVRGYVATPEALHVRRRVLGERALHFIEVIDGKEVELPIAFDQACTTYARIDELYDMYTRLGVVHEDPDDTLRIDVYMNEIDCSDWEAPVLSTTPQPRVRNDLCSQIIQNCNVYLDELAAQAPYPDFLTSRLSTLDIGDR